MSADLEREAREAAEAIAGDTYARGSIYWDRCVTDCSRAFIAAATLREKEMAETNAANEHMLASQDGLIEMVNERNAEIATLRARVAKLEGMVPRWAPVLESLNLFRDGWKVVPIYPEAPGYILFCPPIPAPETKP